MDTVVGFLKNRLPGPVAGQLDNLTAGGGDGGDGVLEKIKQGVGSLVGK